jgi:hypothetical protein
LRKEKTMATNNWTSLGTPGVITTNPSGAPGTLAANPAVGKNADGRLEAFAWTTGVDAVQDLWHIWQTTPGGAWGSWSSLGLPSIILGSESIPGVVENQDGRLEVFATDYIGELWHVWQTAPNGPWSSWASLGNPPNGRVAADFSVHVNSDGRLEVFAINRDGALWHVWQTAPNGTWSVWASLGMPAGLSLPVASQNQDGRLEVFVIGGSDQALWHIWQTKPGGSWGSWFSSGGPQHANPSISRSTVQKNADGRLEVFLMIDEADEPFGTNQFATIWHIWQTAPNGPWSSWASLGSPTQGNRSAPSVRKNQDGRLEAFWIGSDGALWHIWQTRPGGTWGTWNSLGTPTNSIQAQGDPCVAENADGRLEAFVVASDWTLWHTWQVTPGGNWGS